MASFTNTTSVPNAGFWITNVQSTSSTNSSNINQLMNVYQNNFHNNQTTTGTGNVFKAKMVKVQDTFNDLMIRISDLETDFVDTVHKKMTLQDKVTRLLNGVGLDLKDGSRLKIKDGKPFISHRHTDGSEKLRPVPVSHYGTIDLSDSEHHFGPGAIIKFPDNSYVEVKDDGEIVREFFVNAKDKPIDVASDSLSFYESIAFCHFSDIHIPSGADSHATFTLPNGVTIKLFPDDHVEIDESNGRQMYKSEPLRGFNKYLNASDLLEQFIAYCGTQNISRDEFKDLPVSLFIFWLIVQAAEADGDPTDDTLPLLTAGVQAAQPKIPRCKCCGQFLPARMVEHGISFCSPAHMQRFMDKLDAKG
jgi:hypothetical protein